MGRLPRLSAIPIWTAIWTALLWLAFVSDAPRPALASCVEINQTSEYDAAVSTGATTLDLYVPSEWFGRAADGLHDAAGLSLALYFLHSGPIERICVQFRAAPLQAQRLLRFCKFKGASETKQLQRLPQYLLSSFELSSATLQSLNTFRRLRGCGLTQIAPNAFVGLTRLTDLSVSESA